MNIGGLGGTQGFAAQPPPEKVAEAKSDLKISAKEGGESGVKASSAAPQQASAKAATNPDSVGKLHAIA